MQNVILTIHLLLALALIGIVLLQRSEGGGLGIGGGGGAAAGRGSMSALSKVTWVLAVGFLVTSLSLTIIATRKSANSSVTDTGVAVEGAVEAPVPALPDLNGVLTPTLPGDGPALPPAAE